MNEYKEKMIRTLNMVLRDELSASIFYMKASIALEGASTGSISTELAIHSNEEKDHFNRLLLFTATHGMLNEVVITLDREVINFPQLTSVSLVMDKVQALELKAMDDYKSAAICAMKNHDLETHGFFKKLMNEEMKHFDDLAYVNGDSRPLVGLASLYT